MNTWLIKCIIDGLFFTFIQLLLTIPITLWTYYKGSPQAKAVLKLIVLMSIDIIIYLIRIAIIIILHLINAIEKTNILQKKKSTNHRIPIQIVITIIVFTNKSYISRWNELN